MIDEARGLRVTVGVTPPLSARMAPVITLARQRIQAELSGLLSGLGIARQPDVDIQEIPPQPADGLLALRVDGRPCRFPGTAIAEAIAYAEGTPQLPADSAAVLDALRGLEPERVTELVAAVCRAAISAQPHTLLTPPADAALAAALGVGISIAGHDGGPAERLISASAAKAIDVYIDPAYLRPLTSYDSADEILRYTRERLCTELGVPLPPIRLRPDPALRPAAFTVQVNSVRVLPTVGLPAGTILVNATREHLAALDIEAVATLVPATRQPAALTGSEHKDMLEATGLTTWNAIQFFALSVDTTIRRWAHAMMTTELAADMTRQLGEMFPFVAEAAARHVTPDVLAPVLRELLLDGVPVRNLRRILELLLRYETGGGPAPGLTADRVTFVRWGLADLIAGGFARYASTAVVYLLSPEIEEEIAGRDEEAGPDGQREPMAERLSAALHAEFSALPPTAALPALLTRDELRRPLSSMLRNEFPQATVLGYGDLPPGFNVQPVARISLA